MTTHQPFKLTSLIEDTVHMVLWIEKPKSFYRQISESSFFYFGGIRWKCIKNTKVCGYTKPFALKYGSTLIGVNDPGNDTYGNISIQFGAEFLHGIGGLTPAWNRLMQTFNETGVNVLHHKLSRVDICVDVNVPFCEFEVRYSNHQFSTRARKSEALGSVERFNHKDCSLYFGKEDLKLCIYNKLEQLKGKPEVLEWFERCWEQIFGARPEAVTRTEYRLKRKSLHDYWHLSTVEAYQAQRNDLWAYLTKEWFRFTEGPVDRTNGNQARAKTWHVWEAISNVAGGVPLARIAKPKRIVPLACLY